VPYSERRDSTELYRQPYYTAEVAIAPAGAINSSVQDLSRWVIALLNGGAVDGNQVIPNAGAQGNDVAVARDAECHSSRAVDGERT
jgi:CubicO group peptidase (beta-lactamase class C family)